MLDTTKDIQSLTAFRRRSGEFLRQLKKSKRPMVLTVKGKVQGEPFKEPEFFNALMSIWLGHSPADWQLKEQLLGQKT